MSAKIHPEIRIEPERYELRAAAPYRFDLDRQVHELAYQAIND